jgi:hypothetical protein
MVIWLFVDLVICLEPRFFAGASLYLVTFITARIANTRQRDGLQIRASL